MDPSVGDHIPDFSTWVEPLAQRAGEAVQAERPASASLLAPGRAHLVGIAGAGMHALADLLLQAGWSISGSDLALRDSNHVHRLRPVGPSVSPRDRPIEPSATRLRLFADHAAGHVSPDTQVLVYSSAVAAENPELRRAEELGIPTLRYAEMLGRLMAGRRGLAVAGTHGKSSTAAMTAQILVEAGCDPTVVVGAIPRGAASGGRWGRGPWMLVEACEYRGNFLHLRPQHAAILGIEPDHFDCYESLGALEKAFAAFARLLPRDGLLVLRHDCHASRRATAGVNCRLETFGIEDDPSSGAPPADWSARNLTVQAGRYRFQLHDRRNLLGQVDLSVPGRHNVLNALAAAALARAAGAGTADIVRGLGQFSGLHQRLEVLGVAGGVTLVDDYAHHPTEVAVSLDAVRQMFPGRRLWCVFQPHQASRTERLLDELAASLQNADRVLVAEIFRAREGMPRPGEVTSADLARQVRALGAQSFDVHTVEEITRLLESQLAPGDVLLTLGAGDIGRIAHGFHQRF